MPRAKKRPKRISDVPAAARRLLDLPNVGPATALDLVRLGIFEPEKLKGRNANAMYDALCKIDGVRHDPCLLDVFASIVAFANGGPARPWWAFTPERKMGTGTGTCPQPKPIVGKRSPSPGATPSIRGPAPARRSRQA